VETAVQLIGRGGECHSMAISQSKGDPGKRYRLHQFTVPLCSVLESKFVPKRYHTGFVE